MEEAISGRRKAYDAALRSDKDSQAYISTSRHASSVIAKAKDEACRQHARLSHLKLCILSFVDIGSSPHLPPLLTTPTILPGSRLRYLPTA